MTAARTSRGAQKGAFLLEALISILVISFGILGIVGLQARALKSVGDAQYRGEAAFYAATLAGRMWEHDPTDVENYFGPAGTGFTNWSDQITAAGSGLPGAAANPPTVLITDLQSAQGMMAVIKINWQAPGETTLHSYVSNAIIGNNVTP